MTDSSVVLPRYSAEAEPFWQGLREHEVRLQRCNSCGTYQFYPRPLCSRCWSEDIEWKQVSGSAKIYSYTIPGFAPHPSFKDKLPYVVALVDLDEGVRLMTNIVGCRPDEVDIGRLVEPVFHEIDEGHVILHYQLKQESN